MAEELIDPGKETDGLVEEICYCNGTIREGNMLQCILCRHMFHLDCLKDGKPSILVGDVYFDLTCANCSPNSVESCQRQNLSWLQAVYLSLYNLYSTGSGRKGYFRWREDICHFIEQHWSLIFPKKRKTATWCSTVAGVLSSGCPQFFKSGQKEFNREMGWWALQENVPPSVKLGETGAHTRKRKRDSSVATGREVKASSNDGENAEHDSFSEENVIKQPSLPDKKSVPNDTESDEIIAQLLTKEDMQELELLSLPSNSSNEASEQCSLDVDEAETELIVQEETKSDEVESAVSTLTSETSCKNLPSVMDVPQTSSKVKTKPVKTVAAPSHSRWIAVSEDEENEFLHRLASCPKAVYHDPTARRFRRKLLLKQLKKSKNLLMFDLDRSVMDAVSSTLKYQLTCDDVVRVEKRRVLYSDNAEESRRISRVKGAIGGPERVTANNRGNVLDRFSASPHMLPSCHAQSSSFVTRLIGGDSQMLYRHITSPYTARILKPFIRRDRESQPLKLKLLQEIVAHYHRNDPQWMPPPVASIDYCYVQPHYIPSVNAMCRAFFWPGIDLTECLQYPDFSCVVLYRKIVIGFAFMVPDVKYNEAYISFVLVHPEWRRAGIGTYMLYHLIQTCMGKDVTLHVSVTNPAMLMYQKFGFKPEEFILDFYNRYLPENSKECRHAFFLRLRR